MPSLIHTYCQSAHLSCRDQQPLEARTHFGITTVCQSDHLLLRSHQLSIDIAAFADGANDCRWEEDTEGVHVDLRQKSLDWLSECFEAAHQSARQAIDYMCNFIGMKVRYHCYSTQLACGKSM